MTLQAPPTAPAVRPCRTDKRPQIVEAKRGRGAEKAMVGLQVRKAQLDLLALVWRHLKGIGQYYLLSTLVLGTQYFSTSTVVPSNDPMAIWYRTGAKERIAMVTPDKVIAYREAIITNANENDGALLSARLLVPLTAWSIFFALAVLGGLLS